MGPGRLAGGPRTLGTATVAVTGVMAPLWTAGSQGSGWTTATSPWPVSTGALLLVEAFQEPGACHGGHGQMTPFGRVVELGVLLLGEPDVEHATGPVRVGNLRPLRIRPGRLGVGLECASISAGGLFGLLIKFLRHQRPPFSRCSAAITSWVQADSRSSAPG